MLDAQSSREWGRFGMWAVASLTAFFALLIFPVGMVLYPFVALIVWRAARSTLWPSVVGAAFGLGALLCYIGINNLDAQPCPNTITSGGYHACGGVPPEPFIGTGVALSIGAIGVVLATQVARTVRLRKEGLSNEPSRELRDEQEGF